MYFSHLLVLKSEHTVMAWSLIPQRLPIQRRAKPIKMQWEGSDTSKMMKQEVPHSPSLTETPAQPYMDQFPLWEIQKPGKTLPKKEASKSFQLGIYMHKPKEELFTQKVWEAPRIFSQADWWRSFLVQSQSKKTGRGDCFFESVDPT